MTENRDDKNLIKKLFSGLEVITKFLQTALWVFIVVQVLATIIFPIIEIILRGISETPPWLLYLVYGMHLIFGVLATVALFKSREFLQAINIPEMLKEVEKVNKELEIEKARNQVINHEIEVFNEQSIAVKASVGILHELLKTEKKTELQGNEIGMLLQPLLQKRSEALEFHGDDLYNFVVYKFDTDTEELTKLFRDCDTRIEVHNRKWKKGIGYVGTAFAQNQTIRIGDSMEQTDILPAGTTEKDRETYVSYILVPIPNPNTSGNEPYGEFVITSNRKEHFDKEDERLAEIYSGIIATYLTARDCTP